MGWLAALLTLSGTWEPEENLAGTDLLQEWDHKKERMGEISFQRFMASNEAKFDRACKTAEAAKRERQSKRAKKRARNKRSRTIVATDHSEEAAPFLQQKPISQQNTMSPRAGPPTSQEDEYRSLFFDSQEDQSLGLAPALNQTEAGLSFRQSLVARRAPIDQSSSEEEEEDNSTSGEDTDDSMLGEIRAKTQKEKRKTSTTSSRRNMEATLDNSVLSPASPRRGVAAPSKKPPSRQNNSSKPPRARVAPPARDQAEKRVIQQGVEVQHSSRRPSQPAIQTPLAVEHRAGNGTPSASSVAASSHREGVQRAKPGYSAIASTVSSANSMRKTSGSNNLTAIRKSGATTKATGPIKMLNETPMQARKEWRNSDKLYDKLRYRGLAEKRSRNEGAPDLTALEFVGPAPIGFTKPKPVGPADNPYGRREGGNRRVQEDDTEEPRRREPIEDTIPLQSWETGKAPLVCPEWRLSNNCSHGREKCNFMHRHKDENGRDYPVGDPFRGVPPKYRKPPLTCMFWMTSRRGCRKSDDECDYTHRNTGWLPKSETSRDEPVQIDPNALPASELMVR
jgi:chromo domain-containing protein 1